MYYFKIIAYIILISISCKESTQPEPKPQPKGILLNTENSGLPSDNLSCLVIDDNDNKWIGTSDSGLVYYNKNSWVVYNTANSGLPDNEIEVVMFDSEDRVWIGTNGGKLAMFNGENWMVYDESNSLLQPSFSFTALTYDSQGNIWIAMYGDGVAKFDMVNWTLYDLSNSDLPNNAVRSIASDKNDNIWIGLSHSIHDSSGLVKFDGNTWKIYRGFTTDKRSNDINFILVDEMNTLWLGTKIPLIHFIEPKYKLFYISGPIYLYDIYLLVKDRKGTIWLITDNVNTFIKFEGEFFTTYQFSDFIPDHISYIQSIAVDSYNNKWFATSWSGIFLYNEDSITHY